MFPRHLHQPNGRYVVVETQDDLDLLLANGWTLQPEAHVEQPVHVSLYDAKLAIEPKADEAEIVAPKRGKKERIN